MGGSPLNKNKKFCCMILCGYGAGMQSGEILRQHLVGNGMDAVLVLPSGRYKVRCSRKFWIHTVRMKYLALKKEYQQVAVIGISVGGVLQLHLTDLKPAAAVFINSPADYNSLPELRRLFRQDLKSGISGLCTPLGYYQFWRLLQDTDADVATELSCPTLVLQSRDDAVSAPEHAESLFKRLRTKEKSLRYYECGGHNVLGSSKELAVCSDVFQFCSSIRGEQN